MAESVQSLIEKGLSDCECKYCGCMHIAISKASQIIDIKSFEEQLGEEKKDCYECDPCYGAEALNLAISMIKNNN